MLKLAVVTLTRGDYPRWFSQMEDSVEQSMPACGEHFIIKCDSPAALETARWDALGLAEYVCIVDDDDYVLNDSIRICLDALESQPEVAVAFTDERYVDADGQTLVSPHPVDRQPTYSQVYESAQTIHHLALIRTSSVSQEARKLTERLGVGSEWLIKGCAALQFGAVHVPIEGYAWRKHSTQLSAADTQRLAYNRYGTTICAYLGAQARNHGPIPRLTLPT